MNPTTDSREAFRSGRAASVYDLPSNYVGDLSDSEEDEESEDEAFVSTSTMTQESKAIPEKLPPLMPKIVLETVICDERPFGMILGYNPNDKQEIIVENCTPGGIIDTSGRVRPGDKLVCINNDTESMPTSIEGVSNVLGSLELPVILTFRQELPARNRLQEYNIEDWKRVLTLSTTFLLDMYDVDEAAMIVKAYIDLRQDVDVPPLESLQLVENVFSDDSDIPPTFQNLSSLLNQAQVYMEKYRKDASQKWSNEKVSSWRRIDMLSQQRDMIQSKLDKINMTDEKEQEEYLELRPLLEQMQATIDTSKRDFYLPFFENYSLRFGSHGIYIGVGDLYLQRLDATFTLETKSASPHLMLQLNTQSDRGLRLRANHVKVATEGPLPSFESDEINIESRLIADVPVVFDAVTGWTVLGDDLNVEFTSLRYYERRFNSSRHTNDNDTMMKILLNKLLPPIVQYAVQSVLVDELGLLLKDRGAQCAVTGSIQLEGQHLSIYDTKLDGTPTKSTKKENSHAKDMYTKAQDLLALSEEEADVVCRIFKCIETHQKKTFGFYDPVDVTIRNMINYFDRYRLVPHMYRFVQEVWRRSFQLLAGDQDDTSTFDLFFQKLLDMKEYPVNLCVSFRDVTIKLDIHAVKDAAQSLLQRLIRQSAESSVSGDTRMEDTLDDESLESKIDRHFEGITMLLEFIKLNLEKLTAVCRGSMPSGYQSPLFLEASDVLVKGPCRGSFPIPLTSSSTLQSTSDTADATTAFLSALTQENGALVWSKFLKESLQMHSDSDEEEPDCEDALPSDRLRISIREPSLKMLLELPSDLSSLEPGQVLEPFSIGLESGQATPRVRFQTGAFAKYVYETQRLTFRGQLNQLLSKVQDSLDDGESTDADDQNSGMQEEYLDSPFFSIKFQFLSTCQVAQGHVVWSLQSASLSQPKVAQIKHRLSILQTLQDVHQLFAVGDDTIRDSDDRRKHRIHFQKVLATRQARADTTTRFHRKQTLSGVSNMSGKETLFSAPSTFGDVDRVSEESFFQGEGSDGDE